VTRWPFALALVAALAAGCGGSDEPSQAVQSTGTTATHRHVSSTTSSSGVPTTTTEPQPPDTSPGSPHFDTPEAAMTYLAEAWNADDQVSLKHVTNPAARAELDAMHDVATNLRLDRCELNEGIGDYTCYFDHDFTTTRTTVEGEDGEAIFIAGPADKPGWYMTVFESCN
jgi:hypothetical protein